MVVVHTLAVAHLERVGKVPPLSCKLVDAMVLLADFQIVSDVHPFELHRLALVQRDTCSTAK